MFCCAMSGAALLAQGSISNWNEWVDVDAKKRHIVYASERAILEHSINSSVAKFKE